MKRAINSKEIMSMCDGSYTNVSELCNLTFYKARKYIKQERLMILDGHVYIRQAEMNDKPRFGEPRYLMYMDDVKNCLTETKSIRETALLMGESEDSRSTIVRGWRARIRKWIADGKINKELVNDYE